MPPFPAPPKAPRPGGSPFRPRPSSFQTAPPGGKAPMAPGGRPNFRQMGGKTVPMMADGGGIGMPPAIGGSPKAPPAPPPPDMDQDNDNDAGAGPVVRPESVCYHDQLQRCDGCTNYGQDGNCSLLHMQVSPEGACTAWDDAGGGQGQGEGEEGGGMPPGGPEGADMGAGGPQ